MQNGTCLHPPSWQVYDSFSPLSFISDETCRVQLHIHNSSTTFSFGNVTCSPWVICTARLQSSLKAALRETGHCNGHEHRLEEKVPHHPHQEELISSLSKKHHTLYTLVDTTSLADFISFSGAACQALDSFVIQHLLMGVASPFKEEWMNCLASWQHLAFTRCNFMNRVISLIFPIKSPIYR